MASPFYAFEQSDTFGRLVVLLLFFCSVLAWTIIVEKWLSLRQISRHLRTAHKHIDRLTSADELCLGLKNIQGPLRVVAGEAVMVVARMQGLQAEPLMTGKKNLGKISVHNFDQVEAHVERVVDEEIMTMEERLGLLGSIVSAAPFLGLLGTVWGVMIAFCGMAAQGKANINAIAPGVSGALLTTVVGLLVAIPALIGFNLLTNKIKKLTIDLDNAAEQLLGLLKSALVS
ncbi:MAG TPA: flagellar motor protein MotA [Lentisphaeria bacterium]|nr:flagellar motor protein MotA [Lentisphaeria bacterium]|tara:strand:- start:32 stop:721 length:690 start_codon:yes stop_codon:yes gene_type:complete